MDIIKNFKRNKTAFMASILKRVPFLFKDDELYLKLLFLFEMHYWPDLKHPKTFNEKLQWLKLHNRKPEFTTMVDKYAVKKYVADRIGEQYIIPTLGVWDSFDQIDFDSLPNQFVLKTTHGGGGLAVVICKDKKTFDKRRAKRILEKSLNSDIYMKYREWPYKDVPKRIIAEKFMASRKSQALKDLPDYKFFCFNGEPKYCQVIRDRNTGETIDFYDMDWNHQEFVGLNPSVKQGKKTVARPTNLSRMQDICRKLAAGIPFLRVDLYVIDDKEYFGELTFYPASGIGKFTPDDWKFRLGEMLTLPSESRGGVKIRIEDNDIHTDKVSQEYEDLADYKFFCFNGVADNVMVCIDRQIHDTKFYFFDKKWNLLPLNIRGRNTDPSFKLPRPECIEQMFDLAGRLSEGVPFLRVDFYSIDNHPYFGELTFFPDSGLDANLLTETDVLFGDKIKLK